MELSINPEGGGEALVISPLGFLPDVSALWEYSVQLPLLQSGELPEIYFFRYCTKRCNSYAKPSRMAVFVLCTSEGLKSDFPVRLIKRDHTETVVHRCHNCSSFL